MAISRLFANNVTHRVSIQLSNDFPAQARGLTSRPMRSLIFHCSMRRIRTVSHNRDWFGLPPTGATGGLPDFKPDSPPCFQSAGTV